MRLVAGGLSLGVLLVGSYVVAKSWQPSPPVHSLSVPLSAGTLASPGADAAKSSNPSELPTPRLSSPTFAPPTVTTPEPELASEAPRPSPEPNPAAIRRLLGETLMRALRERPDLRQRLADRAADLPEPISTSDADDIRETTQDLARRVLGVDADHSLLNDAIKDTLIRQPPEGVSQ